MSAVKSWVATGLCVLAVGCSSDSNNSNPSPNNPTAPSTPAPAPTLTAPTPSDPADQAQLATLRPTLTVTNGTSNQAGTRTYEFQISDRSDFAALTRSISVVSPAGFLTTTRAGIPEGSDGKTSYAPDTDLQPTTRFYWRARFTQGTTTSGWSATQTFKSKLVGYNVPGELYDPLIHGETVGTRVGPTTFVEGKGIASRVRRRTSGIRWRRRSPMVSFPWSSRVCIRTALAASCAFYR